MCPTTLITTISVIILILHTPWSRVLLEKLPALQLVKKFPAFYRTRRFITTFTSARHLFLSWASSIQSIPPHPTSWRPILILSTHLRLGLPCGLFPAGFLTKTLYTPLPSPIRATCPAHLLDVITRTILGEEYRTLCSSLCSFLHSHVTSSLLGPNMLLNTLFSNTLSLRSSLNVSDQVSHPYKTTGKIVVLHICVFNNTNNKINNNYLINVAIPSSHNLHSTMTEMLQKHADLKKELIRKWQLKTAHIITLVSPTKCIISNKLQ